MTPSLQILVIDDNEDDREVVSRLLSRAEDMDFHVKGVDNGRDAVDALNSGPVDCVILDCSIPGTDSLELLGEISADFPDSSVVMITGLSNEQGAVDALWEGAVDYLLKSELTTASIVGTITKACPERVRKLRKATGATASVGEGDDASTPTHEIATPAASVLPDPFGDGDAVLLVLTDNDERAKYFVRTLVKGGYQNLLIVHSEDDAHDALAGGMPDAILIDLGLPEFDSYAFCRKIRKSRKTRGLPVMALATDMDGELISEVFAAGANDVIPHVSTPSEFLARLKAMLMHGDMFRTLRSFQTRLAGELGKAREMQVSISPSREDIDLLSRAYGLSIDYYFVPSSELSGDQLGLKRIDTNRLMFYMADFSGHGVAAALGAFRLHTLMSNSELELNRPDTVLKAMNKSLSEFLGPGEFATMLCGCIDVDRGELLYASAGHPPPMVMTGEASEGFRKIESKGLPLGLRSNTQYMLRQVDLPPGSRLLLYSDALTESPGEDNTLLGEEGLLDAVNSYVRDDEDCELLKQLMTRCTNKLTRPLPDDLTILSFQCPTEVDRKQMDTTVDGGEVLQKKMLRDDVSKRLSAVGELMSGEFDIQSPQQAHNLATMLSLNTDDPSGIAIGMLELMINGIEHGNLGIGSDLKTELIATRKLQDEIESRLNLPENSEKFVRVGFRREPETIEFTVSDCGEGFDYTKYLTGGPSHEGGTRGRGIYLARTACFHSLDYNETGNSVTARLDLRRAGADEVPHVAAE